MAETDSSLLARWADQKDPVAFNEIAARHGALVYMVCKRITSNPTEAEKVAQECFTFLAHREAPPIAHLSTWLHAVAVNRAQVRTKRDRFARARQAAPAPREGEEVEWADVAAHVDEAIIELPGYLRVPSVAYFLEDLSPAAIARELDLPQQKVSLLLTTAVERMARYVSEQGVAVSGSELKSLIGVNATEAVPATLTVALGEGALSGPAPSKHVLASVEPDITVGQPKGPAILAAVAVLCLVALGAWWMMSREPAPEIKQAQDVPTAESSAQPVPKKPTARPDRTPDRPRPRTARPGRDRATPTPSRPTQALRSVSGVVRDPQGVPVANALLFTGPLPAEPLRAEKALARTSPSGTFNLKDVPANATQLTVWHPFYLPEKTPLEKTSSGPLAVVLSPAAIIEGMVTLAGQPQQGQEIVARTENGSSARARTEPNGMYRISGVTPGFARIAAIIKGPEGQRTMARAAESEVGQITMVDFHFGGLSVALHGAVYVNDEPARSVEIMAFVENVDGATEEFRARTNPEGEYSFEQIAAGPTTMQVRGLRIGRTEHARATVLQTQPGATLQQDFDLRGTGVVVVNVTGLEPGASGIVAALPGGTPVPEVTGSEMKRFANNVLAKTSLRGDGQYTLEGLEGSSYTICAIAVPAGPAPSAGGEDLTRALYDSVTLNVADGAEITLALSPR